MSIFQVPLLVDAYDGTGAPIEEGYANFSPSAPLVDTIDHIYVWQESLPVALGPPSSAPAGSGVLPMITLFSTDSSNFAPTGWAWDVSFQAQGSPASFAFNLLAGSSVLSFTVPQPAAGQPYVFTAAGSAFTAGQPVGLMTPFPASLPSPLPVGFSTGVPYYVVSPAGTSFSLAAYPGGPAIGPLLTVTSAGSGLIAPCQYLSQQAPVVSPAMMQAYVPLSGGTMTGALVPSVVALPFAASIPVNAAQANAFNLTLTASTGTIANPSNPKDGQVIRFRITQGAGGSFTVAWGSAYDFGATGQPVLSTAAGKVDIVGFEYVASIAKWCFLGPALGN
jgi:hypothetical protein